MESTHSLRNAAAGRFARLAETQGNRTPLRYGDVPHTGFEGRAAHQDRRISVSHAAPVLSGTQL